MGVPDLNCLAQLSLAELWSVVDAGLWIRQMCDEEVYQLNPEESIAIERLPRLAGQAAKSLLGIGEAGSDTRVVLSPEAASYVQCICDFIASLVESGDDDVPVQHEVRCDEVLTELSRRVFRVV